MNRITGRLACLFVVVVALLSGTLAIAGDKVGWMIYPYLCDERLQEEQFERMLACKDADYAGFQIITSPGYSKDIVQKRFAKLKEAGKRVVLQLWYGPGKPFSWERYNYPNVALDPKIRKEFFAKVTDPLLDFVKPENLYAVHIMEETGMQFGWDVDIPARIERDDDGFESGNSFDNPSNFPWDRGLSGPEVRTIRHYNDLFKKDTGLDMLFYPVWSNKEMATYKNWVQVTMEAGMHTRFADHVHEKYPGLKVYSFNMGPALVPQAKVLDGQFIDPYTDTTGVYMSLRGFRRIMRPEMDLVSMVWGNRDKPMEQRMPQQAAAYLAGSNVLSTFGDGELKDPQWLKTVHESVRPFLGLPVFRASPRTLVLYGEGWGATLRNAQFWITGFANYDALDPNIGASFNLKQYDLILSWGVWDREILEWVRDGGVLVAVHPPDDFVLKEGYLEEKGTRGRKTIEYHPDKWMKENLHLRDSYSLELDMVQEYDVKNKDAVHQDQFLSVFPYGKGLVVWLPAICWVHPPWKYEPSWEAYRQLLTDICRGALQYKGENETAMKCFDDPALGNDYLHAVSDDGRTEVYVLLVDAHGSNRSPTSFVVPGLDRVSGKENARLSQEQPVIVIHKEENQ